MSAGIQLIVGLCNPGKEYANTRHNAGAWFVEEIAQHAKASLRLATKFHGLYNSIQINDQVCHLLIPTTFMNHSGQSVRACMNYHKIAPESLLIVHDEIDLPVGTIKLKFDGGDGGHNGLKDVIRHLNTKQFHRLRIGVSHPGNSKDVVDYVLKNPSKVDRIIIDEAMQKAEVIIPLLITGHIQQAMHKLHTTETNNGS